MSNVTLAELAKLGIPKRILATISPEVLANNGSTIKIGVTPTVAPKTDTHWTNVPDSPAIFARRMTARAKQNAKNRKINPNSTLIPTSTYDEYLSDFGAKGEERRNTDALRIQQFINNLPDQIEYFQWRVDNPEEAKAQDDETQLVACPYTQNGEVGKTSLTKAQCQKAQIEWEKKYSKFNYFARNAVQGLTDVADFAVDKVGTVIPGVAQVIAPIYKAFAPPTSKFYTNRDFGSKLIDAGVGSVETLMKLKGKGKYVKSYKRVLKALKKLRGGSPMTWAIFKGSSIGVASVLLGAGFGFFTGNTQLGAIIGTITGALFGGGMTLIDIQHILRNAGVDPATVRATPEIIRIAFEMIPEPSDTRLNIMNGEKDSISQDDIKEGEDVVLFSSLTTGHHKPLSRDSALDTNIQPETYRMPNGTYKDRSGRLVDLPVGQLRSMMSQLTGEFRISSGKAHLVDEAQYEAEVIARRDAPPPVAPPPVAPPPPVAQAPDVAVDVVPFEFVNPMRIGQGRFTPDDYDEMFGSGIFSSIKSGISKVIKRVKDVVTTGIRRDYPPSVRKFLLEQGNSKITSMMVRRDPIGAPLNTVLNLISLGKWNELRTKYGYDKLFHLGLEFTIASSKYVIEKNEVINIAPAKATTKDTQTYPIKLNGTTTLNTLLPKAQKAMGDKYFTYSAFENNCQDFILAILRSNGLGDSGSTAFIKQDLQKVTGSMPTYVRKIAQLATDIGAVANVAMEGRGGMKPRAKFAKQLASIGVSAEAYLDMAREKAKSKGLAWKHLGFSDDDKHKLQIPNMNGKVIRFGAVGSRDFVIYSLSQSAVGEKSRKSYLARANKIPGDWKEDSYSPNSLAISILW
jgi:hypothetical protein